MAPLGNTKLGSCGAPISRSKAKVINHEISDQALGPYQHGELYVSGPQVMKGYLNNSKATNEMIDEEGWLRTGDVAYYDDDGNFYIVDRLKELIKVKGLQVRNLYICHFIKKPIINKKIFFRLHQLNLKTFLILIRR
jgi:4-coumarate--CoA ligase